MTETTPHPHPRTARFRELKADIGLSLPALATALGRPLGTLTGYTHSGNGSRVPPQAVIDEMEGLLLKAALERIEKAKRIVDKIRSGLTFSVEVDPNWLVGQGSPPTMILSKAHRSAFVGGATETTDAHP
ncbi:MAG TPA: hypothetical protein VGO06_16035 [Bosea sp. (in: a-proteobacteria)]|jgi:hypothetical protein|uniref:hypothetical protein n=1 Tax=Bosea sp. (in: a-proteobacteria) TaxID=1871050 RepID=UPI002E13653F|nr:hypothetical protein [Bosea sp. (in: a-proteobacteria)]